MMADNIEHVITYWVLWQKFHSEALVGFQVISHWVPFLLFSVYFGSLADRFDCRRVIQVGQGLFMFVSIAWGVLFLTDSLQIWQACVLLVLHGIAGALWGPAEQLMLHDFVGTEDLPSAVRLNATFKSLGILFGPVVGSALLLGSGPVNGIFANVAIYLPLTMFLFRTRFTGHLRDGGVRKPRIGVRDAIQTAAQGRLEPHPGVDDHPGWARFLLRRRLPAVGDAGLRRDARDGRTAGRAYGVLLFATGAGGVLGGLLLEATGKVKPSVPAAVVSTAIYGLAILGFAVTRSYPLAVALLFLAGVANLASMSIGQTVVQLMAPPDERGRVIGVYGMSTSGLRAGSGFTVGLLGAAIGVHWSLGLSAAALCVGTGLTAIYALRPGANER